MDSNGILRLPFFHRKVTELIGAFVEWDARGVAPLTCYIPYYTVWTIYGEAKCFMRTGKLSGIFKIDREKDYFRVGKATMYAKGPNEKLLKKFVDIVHAIAKDHDLLSRIITAIAEMPGYPVKRHQNICYLLKIQFRRYDSIGH